MLYVEQSLTAGEKILHVGRFHWIYVVSALFWLVLGFVLCIAILTGGFTWDVRTDMQAAYPNLPAHLFWEGWARVVDSRGGYIAVIRETPLGIKMAGFGALLVGVVLFAQMMIVRATTEIAVTNKRLVIKEGVIARRVDEMDIDHIESVHVWQSVLGRLLDYGVVMVRGMGVGEISLPALAHPVILRKSIENAKYVSEAAKARVH